MKLLMSKKGPIVSKRQDGFTLLELLVVITLLAIISLGALVAYEGLGEVAEETAASNNISASDRAIRTFAFREGVYPNQWDNLVNLDDGTVNEFIAEPTQNLLAALDLTAVTDTAGEQTAIVTAMENAGLTEFQSLVSTSVFSADAIPNESWNESSPGTTTDPADELEIEIDEVSGAPVIEFDGAAATVANISVVASAGDASNGGTCTVGGQSLAANIGAAPVVDSVVLNRINDFFDDDGCHLVVAVGFGKDVPGTTINSTVAIAGAPTFTSENINPSENYARYIALFHVGSDDDATPGVVSNFRNAAKLIAIVDTEGNNIDQTISGAFQEDDINN